MKKKLMTLVLACAMVLAACGTAQKDETPTTAPATGNVAGEVTKAPVTEPTEAPVVEPTEVPAAEPTEAPVVEPTEVPAAEPTEAPATEPTEAPATEPTEAPAAEPTEAPVAEPTEAPVAEPTKAPTPAPTEAPKEEIKDYATVLTELHTLTTYEEREAYVAKLNKAAYAVNETEDLEVIAKECAVAETWNYYYDMELGEFVTAVAPDSKMKYPVVDKYVLANCCDIDIYDMSYEDMDKLFQKLTLMTLTNLATGEVDPWGVKIERAGVKETEVVDEYWGVYTETAIDPDIPSVVSNFTVEKLVEAYNMDGIRELYVDLMVYRPMIAETDYDDYGNPIGQYYVLERNVENIYVDPSEVLCENYYGESYYYFYREEYDDYGSLSQDENGDFYYTDVVYNKISPEELGYELYVADEYNVFLLDKEGNLVIEEIYNDYRYMEGKPITTWDTLKYYDSLYNPQLWDDLGSYYHDVYAIADLKAENFSYVDADKFDVLVKHYLDSKGIVLDEEVLAIRATMPEGWGYSTYYDKAGVISNAETGAMVTIARQENWYFKNYEYDKYDARDYGCTEGDAYCYLVVYDENYSDSDAKYSVNYEFINTKPALGKAAVEEVFADSYWDSSEIKLMEVNGKPVYYTVETTDWYGLRDIMILQDIGEEYFVEINCAAMDLETDLEELIGKFLINVN